MRKDLIRQLIAALILLFCLTNQAVSQSSQPSTSWQGWATLPPPSDSELQCGNYSNDEWVVSSSNGTVMPSKRVWDDAKSKLPDVLKSFNKKSGRKVYLNVDYLHHWLVGADAGEFGGGLWLFDDEAASSVELLQENVHAILRTGAGAYILTGLAHMTMDQGDVYFFPINGSRQDLKRIGDLGSAPSAFTEEREGAFLVVTTAAVLRLAGDGAVTTVHRRYLGSLYPSSIALDDKNSIYIGMRFFVLKLTPTGEGYSEDWMVPNRCRKSELKEYHCVCTAKD